MTKRVNVWSGPRNISTALMYSFAQRADTTVLDEPLYAHYLDKVAKRATHPGEGAILESMEKDGGRIVDTVFLGPYPTDVVFFKNMAHHLVELDWSFLKKLENVILTRDPRDMLMSFSKTIESFGLVDTGYEKLAAIVNYLVDQRQKPIVLDSRRLLEDPPGVLGRLCDRLGIEFSEEMLSWEPGARPEDGVWAPHWYHNVHRSTGFAPYRPKADPFPERLETLYEACHGHYEKLLPYAL